MSKWPIKDLYPKIVGKFKTYKIFAVVDECKNIYLGTGAINRIIYGRTGGGLDTALNAIKAKKIYISIDNFKREELDINGGVTIKIRTFCLYSNIIKVLKKTELPQCLHPSDSQRTIEVSSDSSPSQNIKND